MARAICQVWKRTTGASDDGEYYSLHATDEDREVFIAAIELLQGKNPYLYEEPKHHFKCEVSIELFELVSSAPIGNPVVMDGQLPAQVS